MHKSNSSTTQKFITLFPVFRLIAQSFLKHVAIELYIRLFVALTRPVFL